MVTVAVYTDGSPVPPGFCITPDHYNTTFILTVRTMRPCSEDRLKDIIQKQIEVTNIQIDNELIVAR